MLANMNVESYTTTEKSFARRFCFFSKASSSYNRLGCSEVLTEAVTNNRLAKSINRGGHFKTTVLVNRLFSKAVVL
jgi:hypothetical protein